jgi:hypothetical protein
VVKIAIFAKPETVNGNYHHPLALICPSLILVLNK